jgi:hypothetical protein
LRAILGLALLTLAVFVSPIRHSVAPIKKAPEGAGSAPMKKPRRLAGARFRKGKCYYIFGLHFLACASQTPPAFVQSASVFAETTSAAKAGAVTAKAKPKATIIETSFVIG